MRKKPKVKTTTERNPRTGRLKTTDDIKFEKLQAKWYKKLDETGFDDIERSPGVYGLAENTMFLKRSAFLAGSRLASKPGNAEYYRIMSNYLRCHRWTDKFYKRIFTHYCEGVSYRDILTKVNRHQYASHPEFPMKIRRLHKLIKQLTADALQWNKTSSHGLNSPKALAQIDAELALGLYSGTPYSAETGSTVVDVNIFNNFDKDSDDNY